MIKPYNEVEINRDIISQADLNIENRQRTNLFAWNGQFSPQFIETLLSQYANSNDIVFDPFLGSGTTLCESARMNISALGTELNASAFYMAKTYELINMELQQRNTLIEKIELILNEMNSEQDIVPTITKHIECNDGEITSNILKTLIILMDIFNHDITFELLNKKWNGLKNIILGLPYSNKSINAIMGDARKVNVADDVATILITSPPYINVFNYHQKYRRSVEALGYDVLAIAKNEFGSNRKHRGNRFFTVIQYCIDMALSMAEASRVCTKNARMIYIVGRESSVLGYSFCNSQLIYEIGTEIFDFLFLVRQERAFKNRFGQIILEDILHFTNKKSYGNMSHDFIISMARSIAVRMLTEKLQDNSENKSENLLYEAIQNADKIKKSEG